MALLAFAAARCAAVRRAAAPGRQEISIDSGGHGSKSAARCCSGR